MDELIKVAVTAALDRSKVICIMRDGSQVSLDTYQKAMGLPMGSTRIGQHFDLKEARFQKDIQLYGRIIIYELLFRVLDQFRTDWGHPININALNRDSKHQALLQQQGFRAATISPHVVREAGGKIVGGYAADVDTKTKEETDAAVKVMIAAARKLNIKIRLGWKQYQQPPAMTFFHVDICPEYCIDGKPHSRVPGFIPKAWTYEARW